METFVPAGDSDFDSSGEFEEYEFEHETDLNALSSFHGDIPAAQYDNVKPNCFVDSVNDNAILLLSDLQNAVISGSAGTVKNLISNRPDYCNSVLDSGWTPLTYASSFGHIEVIDVLLHAGANVDLVGSDGCTSLMAACKCPRERDAILILKKLFDLGADPLLVDKNGKTLLMYAVRKGHYDLVDLVLKYTNDIINSKDNKGWTALDWAISKAFDNIILLLIKHGATEYISDSESLSLLSDNVKTALHSLVSKFHEIEDNPSEPTKDLKEPDLTKSQLQDTSLRKLRFQDSPARSDYAPPSHKEEDPVTINFGVDGDGYQKYGQLELLLSGLNLSHLIPKFHEHDVQFEQLLCISTEDLIAIGINQVGVRNRILTAVKDWHTSEWQENSLLNFSSTALTFTNLQALLRTSSEHVLYISSALRYAKNQLKSYPQVLKPSASLQLNKDPDEILLTQVEDLLVSTHQLCRSLKLLHSQTMMITAGESNQYHQVDNIKADNKVSGRKLKYFIVSLPFLAGLAFFVTKLRNVKYV